MATLIPHAAGLIVTVLIFIQAAHVLVRAECGRGRFQYEFGPDCLFQCHCNSNERCDDVTGACPGGCQQAWMGPGCQYENVAYEKAVDSNYGIHAHLATDGNMATCMSQTEGGINPSVRVYMGDMLPLAEVEITFSDYALASGFSVYIGTTFVRDEDTLCATDNGRSTSNTVIVICSQRMTGTYVTVYLSGMHRFLEICEIKVHPGRVLEYKRPAFMSSIEGGYGPENAVDGGEPWMSVTVKELDPWFYVDLGGLRRLHMVIIYNRKDLPQYLMNFQVWVSNSSDFSDKRLVHTDVQDPIPVRIPVITAGIVARYVKISVQGTHRSINIAMINVFGSCIENHCGMDCTEPCHCGYAVKSSTNEIEGTCEGDCDRNWSKVGGYCNTSVCDNDSFGYGCKYSCNCEGRCDPWTGRCLLAPSMCRPHYYGDICQAYNVIRESRFTAEGNGSYVSADATVDGDLTTCGDLLSGPSASWIVTLSAVTRVDQILVFVNADSMGDGFDVTTESNGHANSVTSCVITREGTTGPYMARCGHETPSHIRLKPRTTLQVCEVAVLECVDGTYGVWCTKLCNCRNREPCDKLTGRCPTTDTGGDICDPGFSGTNCDTECQAGYHGYSCKSSCGHCIGSRECDIFTGACTNGCLPGWEGDRCDTECADGTYGDECGHECGFCLDGEPCRKDTGRCAAGCAAGYFTDNCTIACESGWYGYNCNNTCGDCADLQPCDRVNGTCTDGCIVGKQQPLCQIDCPAGRYGPACVNTCGECRENSTCNPVTGVCEHGCDFGVYVDIDAPICDVECVDGFHGYNCSERCTEAICMDTDICNKTDGACPYGCAHAGVQLPLCQTECCDGTYGHHCGHLCGMCLHRQHCDKATGACPHGCADGFVGLTCDTSEWSQKLSTASTVIIVFGVLLALLGVAGLLLAYWITKRRNVKYRDYNPKSDEKPPRNPSLVSHVYDNDVTSDDVGNEQERTNINNDATLTDVGRKGTVAVKDLWEHVMERKATKAELVQQFKELPAGLVHPCESAKKPPNLGKNRYKEIFPYDHSRVKLDPVPGDVTSDYINASFISGYNRPNMYIAAQGPTADHVTDFWRMVWQTKCRKIIMLTRLVEQNKVKCSQYWPDDGGRQYGTVHVQSQAVDAYADYDIRTFIISSTQTGDNEKRQVRQFHYTAWTDRTVPEYPSSVVQFWSKVRTSDQKDNVPVIVHCSAGIGRTGTFLALDYLADQARIEGYVNVGQCVQNLRHQRVNMIQTQEQYLFLHDALAEALFCPSTAVPCETIPSMYKGMFELDPASRKANLLREYEKLQHITKFNESLHHRFYENVNYKSALKVENRAKNRHNTILPSDVHRPWLYSRVEGHNDYINAVYLPTHRVEKTFIITQNPLPNTIVDFWRLVYENKVASIVDLDEAKTQTEIYWPGETETRTYIPYQIVHMHTVEHLTYIERTMKLTNGEDVREKPRIIKQFRFKMWVANNSLPTDTGSLTKLHEHVTQWQKTAGNSPVLVHCMDGVRKSGLYCVIASTIQRLKEQREVALQQTIKQMRIRRHQIVPTYEQYKYCHDVILDFLRDDTDPNFYI